MPRKCSICFHDQRAAIDVALVRGASYRFIAAQYGLSTGALQRHRDSHLPKLLTTAEEAEERLSAGSLLRELEGLKVDAERIGQMAEEGGDLSTALRAVGERRALVSVSLKGIELVALEERLDALERSATPHKRIA